jgi:hypothetical protein
MTHGMLTMILPTDPDLFGLDAPVPALDGGGWCCFIHILPLRSGMQWRGFINCSAPARP